MATGESLLMATGGDLNVMSGAQLTVHSGQAIGVLAGAAKAGEKNAGLSMIAAQGPINIQAQSDSLNLDSEKALQIVSANAEARYALALTGSAAHGYTVLASAIDPRSDRACTTLSLSVQGGQTVYGATGEATARSCWNR